MELLEQIIIAMDSFFAKKGLTLSRNGNNSKATREQLLRSQEITLCPPPQPDTNTIHTLQKHQHPEQSRLPNAHLSVHLNREEKSASIGPSIRLISQRQKESQSPFPKHSQWKFTPVPHPPKSKQISLNSSSEQQRGDSSKLSIVQNHKSSLQGSLEHEKQSFGEHANSFSETKQLNKLKMTMDAHRIETQSAKLYRGYFEKSPIRSIEKIEPKIRSYAQQNSRQYNINHPTPTNKHITQEWFDQKLALLKQINQKALTIRDLEGKLLRIQRQMTSKINNLELQLKIVQDSRSRLQAQRQNTKNQLLKQRERHQKAQQSIHKLIFFEDDLIHAKDYTRLKQELQYVLTQNALMFQQHQQYIISVTEARRIVNSRLQEVENQMKQLRKQYERQRQHLQVLSNNAQDKLQLIKLQNDLNFLKKKSQESTEVIIAKEKQLQQAKILLKNLTEQHNQHNQTSQKFMEQVNMQQIKETIAAYEVRLQGLTDALSERNSQVERLKRALEKLAQEVRTSKEERHINSMKERSSENSLRNQVETLQRELKGHQDIAAKRTAALQDSLQRKAKQITEKDTFIKNFLLSRAKQIESASAQTILKLLKDYFCEPQSSQ